MTCHRSSECVSPGCLWVIGQFLGPHRKHAPPTAYSHTCTCAPPNNKDPTLHPVGLSSYTSTGPVDLICWCHLRRHIHGGGDISGLAHFPCLQTFRACDVMCGCPHVRSPSMCSQLAKARAMLDEAQAEKDAAQLELDEFKGKYGKSDGLLSPHAARMTSIYALALPTSCVHSHGLCLTIVHLFICAHPIVCAYTFACSCPSMFALASPPPLPPSPIM